MSGDLGKSVFIVINLKKILKNLKSLVFCTMFSKSFSRLFQDLKKTLSKSTKILLCFLYVIFGLVRHS